MNKKLMICSLISAIIVSPFLDSKESHRIRHKPIDYTQLWSTTIEEKSILGNFIASLNFEKIYKTPKYKSGFFDNYFEYKILSIKEYKGVYSHFQYYSKYLLESGSASFDYSKDFNYKTSMGKTVNFLFTVNKTLEMAFYTELDIVSDFSSAGSKINSKHTDSMMYSYGTFYTRKSVAEYNMSEKLHLGRESAEYCPDGYSMSIGLTGKFWEIEFEYRNVVAGIKKDAYKNSKAVLSDESEMSYNFVYRNDKTFETGFYI